LLTGFSLAAGSKPQQIVSGPDGALWFTETGTNVIGRMTTRGALSELAIPTPLGLPFGITRGRDGKLWFTEQNGNTVGYVVA
jgi:virginiamycin B lyase